VTRLAELAGISPSYISQIENGGRRAPQPEILRKIAPHLQVGFYELMIKAGYLVTSSDELRIDDPSTKEIFASLTEGKKELLRVIDGLSEETLFTLAETLRRIR
jgi:transcriptional regulator with XRE-family HTH domain